MFLEKKPTIPHTPYELLESLLLLKRDFEALLKVNPHPPPQKFE
jgi:hypothetical protein